jgi:hypothetical protein
MTMVGSPLDSRAGLPGSNLIGARVLRRAEWTAIKRSEPRGDRLDAHRHGLSVSAVLQLAEDQELGVRPAVRVAWFGALAPP